MAEAAAGPVAAVEVAGAGAALAYLSALFFRAVSPPVLNT